MFIKVIQVYENETSEKYLDLLSFSKISIVLSNN